MNLLQYICNIEALEKEKYTMECTIRKIDSTLKTLGLPYEVRRAHNPVSIEDTKFSPTQIIIMICAVLYGILGLYAISVGPQFAFTLILVFLLPAAIVIFCVIASVKGSQDEWKQNQQRIEQKYNNDKAAAQRMIEQEKKQAVYYRNARNKLYQAYQETCNLLARLYSMNIIYEKYQYDLVAICMFAEYFKSGRCSTFIGHEGAYNIFEDEKYKRLILFKLDEIIERLDRIENNQYGLYIALKEVGKRQEQIISNLRVISQKQSQQIENAEYMRYEMEVLRTNSQIAMLYGMPYK